jgi:hypothetical protein
LARTAGLLDPRARTLFIGIAVDNLGQFLVPGAFAYVTPHPEIPVAGPIVRGNKTIVAGVGDDGLVPMRPVMVASIDGIGALLTEGARLGDKIAMDLPD